MRRDRLLAILLAGASLAGLLFIAAHSWAAELTLKERVEKVAAQLPWYDVGDAVYDRDPHWGPDASAVARALKLLEPPPVARRPTSLEGPATTPAPLRGAVSPIYEAPVWPVDDIRALLKHDDPRVRTLALVLLYGLNRVDVLPDIASLANDESETFQTPLPPRAVGPQPTDWPMEKTTVAAYARAMLKQYERSSDELNHLDLLFAKPGALVAKLHAFAAKRDPCLSTAGLRVALERATGGISPLQPDRMTKVEAVLHAVDGLPSPRLFFVAVALGPEYFRSGRYSPDFLLYLARQTPRAVRVACISGERPIDDPDLAPGFGSGFFLEHAVDLFTEQDADLMLRLDAQSAASIRDADRYGGAPPDYAIAAAMLDPRQADRALRAAMQRLTKSYQQIDRARVAVALVRYGTDRSNRAALDWLFSAKPEGGQAGGRDAFLGFLQQQDPLRYRNIVAQIIADQRLDSLGPATSRMLVESVQGYLGESLVPQDQIRDSHRVNEAQDGRKFQHLADWHTALRATLARWRPEEQAQATSPRTVGGK